MTVLTKAQNKLSALRESLPQKVSEKLENGIESLVELINLFSYRKRKSDKNGLKSLYDWFDDEFNVRYEAVTVRNNK